MDIAARIRTAVVQSHKAAMLAVTVLLCSAGSAQAAFFLEDFSNTGLDSSLQQTTDSGFSLAISSDRARLDKASGTGNGELRVSTTFQVLGDFVASLEVERIDLVSDASVGLMARHDSFGSNDLGLISNNFGFSRMQIAPTNSTFLDSNTASNATLRMTRTGSTILHEIDFGAGFVALDSQSQANHADPLTLSFFLRQQYGDTSDQLAWVDNFQITADGFTAAVPSTAAPAPAGFTLGGLIAGLLLARRRLDS